MRLLPGQPLDVAGESISSYSLIRAAVNNPDVLPRVWQVFADEEAPLSALLAAKGLTSKGLVDGMNTSAYRVVKSNHVMYPIKNSDVRKPRLTATDMTQFGGTSSATYYCPFNPTSPGKNLSVVYVALDSNWARPNEVLEFNDNETKGFIYDHEEPIEVNGAFVYAVKLVTNNREDFFNPGLLAAGNETGVGMTMYEHDFSETGHEKYTYDGWGHAYMTLQRIKMSYSGTAAAMGEDASWYAFQNAKGRNVAGYIDYADKMMWKRIAAYHEYQMIFGRSTVDIDGNTLMKDRKGRDIMAGDGLLYQGEGAYDKPMNKWTKKFLHGLLRDVDIRAGKDGHKEVLLAGGWELIQGFSDFMAESGFVTMNNNIVGSTTTAEKGIDMDYSWYQYGDVRIIPKRLRWFDSMERPHKYLSDGTSKGSWDGFVVPMGLTEGGDKGLELIQLRPPKSGTVSGIDKGGEMASSVDGTSKHVLVQSGIISRHKLYRIFRPYNT